MTGPEPGERRGGARSTALAVVLVLQALAAAFFAGDAVADITLAGLDLHVAMEAVIALALAAGVVFGAREMRRMVEQADRSEAALMAARGALGELIEARFAHWGLTPAEASVALMALKGFDVAAIAGLRGAAPGTVRAQLAHVYAKAGVASRAELLAVFIDDLLEGPVEGPAAGGDELPAAREG